jgi:hypothetical protein
VRRKTETERGGRVACDSSDSCRCPSSRFRRLITFDLADASPGEREHLSDLAHRVPVQFR